MGRVSDYIAGKLVTGKLHFALIDPDGADISTIDRVAAAIQRAGCDAIMVGGSTSAVGQANDLTIQAVKKGSTLPVIIFPGNWSAVSPHADAIFFMSILNSRNPYFITKAQALGAYSVKMFNLEPLPMGYLVVEPGETVGWIAEADPIPRRKPKIAAAYALAAQFMGMDLVYLEAGSGASEPVPDSMISMVRAVVDIPILVGGGIRTPEQASRVVRAGADIVVTGTLIERAENIEEALSPIVRAVKGES